MKGDQIVSSSSLLSTALAQDEKELYKSDYGRSSENRAKALARLIRAAIKLSDISILLQIERNAIMADMAAYGATEKRTGALASLEQAGRLIERTSTPKGARQFLISMNGDKLPAKIPRTDMVINFIKSQKIQINSLMDATASSALKNYYLHRKMALECTRNVYIKNLNRGLGKEIGKDNEISR